jgi:succinyl-CoA synthetase alpha subunit
MRPLVTKPFPYFVGVYSLEELVTRKSRVCVINILGNESRKVTPVSQVYSGGNIVAGVQYGRRGVLETDAGDIPVYHSVRDVMKHGHDFDIGVIYLPPAAVSQAVWELVRFNSALKRIVIVTEKVSARDSRNIRDICQSSGVDVIGANCLGVANAWDHVRVGGALGGDHPEETLRKGTVAIHSNSGNFTSTIAEYLKVAGFGITTAVSSGKDVIVHFARHAHKGRRAVRGAGRVLREDGARLDSGPAVRVQQTHGGLRHGAVEDQPGTRLRSRRRHGGLGG